MPSPGRPGPRLDLDVPTILLDSAERLFALQGVSSVSLRAVGREAGVSSAGVLYHYSSKPALLAGVIRRRGNDVGQQTRTNLIALLGRSEDLSARDLVDALLEPMVALINTNPDGGLCWLKLLVQLAATENEVWYDQMQADPPLDVLVLSAAERAMPALDRSELQRRLAVGVNLMLTALAGADLQGYGNPIGADGLDPAFVETIARFTAAGLAAP